MKEKNMLRPCSPNVIEPSAKMPRSVRSKREIVFPQRQIHLDFHTGMQAPDVGIDFEPGAFAERLKRTKVQSITCFSRCLLGMIYHDTKFPARHPNLRCNLLAEQIEACHKVGIRVPIYMCVGWDNYQLSRNPSLAQIMPDGVTRRITPRITMLEDDGPGWTHLCLNSKHTDYVIEQAMEVLDLFEVDGIFFDIITQDCCCPHCIDLMRHEGLDPHDSKDRHLFNAKTELDFKKKMNSVIRSRNQNCTIFFNAGHIDFNIRGQEDLYTHFELESLPSGGWGYDHFGITGRYTRRLEKKCLMMTGCFHSSWGDFGSYKSQAALEYECLRGVSMGHNCSIGTQLHPRGKLDEATFDLIESVYSQVEALEPYVKDAKPVAEVAVVWANSGRNSEPDTEKEMVFSLSPSDRGAYRVCLEEHLLFDFIDPAMDMSKYRLLILPDTLAVDESFAARLAKYLDAGGSIICSWKSGLNLQHTEFALPIPLKVEGPPPILPEYIVSEKSFNDALPCGPLIMYETGFATRSTGGKIEILAHSYRPYYNRKENISCGHQHWPVEGPTGSPAIIKAGRIIYFVHPIFKTYANSAAVHYKRMVANAINILMPEKVLSSNLPSTAQVELLAKDNRMILSVLHYVPENRCPDIPTIEESLPLIDVEIELAIPSKVKKVNAILPKDQTLKWESTSDKVNIRIDKMRGKLFLELVFGN